jgi:hypothetical protein
MQPNTRARLPVRYSHDLSSKNCVYSSYFSCFNRIAKRPSDEGSDSEFKFGRYETRAVSHRPPSISQNFSSLRNESVSNGSSGPCSSGQRGVNGNWRGTSEYERKQGGY